VAAANEPVAGSVYLVGLTDPERDDTTDLFARKYTPSGSVAWTYQAHLPRTYETAYGVSARSREEVYVSGATDGKVNGENYGGEDAFLLRLDGQGRKVWSR